MLMKRREFMAAALNGAVATWPLMARAQQSATPVVGLLASGLEAQSPHVIGFGKGLSDTGFVEGRNVDIQYRFAEGHYERLPAMVAELVNRHVAVLAATGGVQTALAAKAANTAIPVVFANGSDPVQFGLVESLNRPGGNITGVSFFTATLEAKRLDLLFEIVPAAHIFGILINPTNDNAENQMKDIAQGGLTLSRPIIILKASNEQEIETAFEAFAQQGVDALLVGSDPYFYGQRQKIVALAARYRLPAIYEWREFVQSGGLASYGTNLWDNYRLAGISVGRILKGEKPADLPVVQATKFEFIINLRTAKSLGLTLPSGPLSTTDEVIE
jgi:putative tryptophan/tyrosine transport system substrate-binding protein